MENSNTEIERKDNERHESTGQQRDGVNQKIILFVIGVLVGAVVSTGAFLAYIKIAGVGSSSNSLMQGGPGGTPPEMQSGSSSSGQNGQPPEIPGGSSSSGQSGTPPEMPGNSNGSSSSNSSNNAQNGNS